MKGDEIKGAFLLVLDKDNNIVDNEVIIHSGLIFCSNKNIEDSSNFNSELYSITDYFVQYLTKNFKRIEFNTVPDFLDLRPFLWHNYSAKKCFHMLS